MLLTGAGVGKEEVATDEEAGEKVEGEEVIDVAGLGTEPETPGLAGDEKVALAPALWLDPDVRWLTGVHEGEGHLYVVREQYEELLWWLLMPSLLRLAGEATPSRDAIAELSQTVNEALATAEASGYRIDTLLGTKIGETSEESEATAAAVELGIVGGGGEPDSELINKRNERPEE